MTESATLPIQDSSACIDSDGMSAITGEKPPTQARIADLSSVSRAMVGRIMRADPTVNPDTRARVIAVWVENGGAWTDIPIPEAPPQPNDPDSWPYPRYGKRSADQLREDRAFKARNMRARKSLIADAELAGLTVEDLEAWCKRHVGGPYTWDGELIKLWSRPEFEWHREHLIAWVRAQLPPEALQDKPREFRIPACRGCGQEFMATASNKPKCAECEQLDAEAAATPKTYHHEACSKCVWEGVEDPSFDADHHNTRYCKRHSTV